MSDLVQLLRQLSAYGNSDTSLGDDAADEIERLTAELAKAQQDAERLDFLESLIARTEYQNQKRPTESVGTDLHIHDGRAAIYIRNLFGDVVKQGHGDSVRAAIDAAIGEKA